jgi:hypothetical protein
MKIIFHAWRTYKSIHVKHWRNKMNPFSMYKDLREEDWDIFLAKCEAEDFVTNSQYMQWLQSQNKLDHHLSNTSYAKNRGSGNRRMTDWPSKVLRIHMTNFVDG